MIKFDYDDKYDILDVWINNKKLNPYGVEDVDIPIITRFYNSDDLTIFNFLTGFKIFDYTKHFKEPVMVDKITDMFLKLIKNNKTLEEKNEIL